MTAKSPRTPPKAKDAGEHVPAAESTAPVEVRTLDIPPVPLTEAGQELTAEQWLRLSLSQAQAQFPPVRKLRTASVRSDRTGKTYSYRYADLSDVVSSVTRILSSHGLSVVQTFRPEEGRLIMTTTLHHFYGAEIRSELPLPDPLAMKPQEFGSAITYARRYALTSLLGIAAEEDDDGEAAAAAPAAKPAYTPVTGSGRARIWQAAREMAQRLEVEEAQAAAAVAAMFEAMGFEKGQEPTQPAEAAMLQAISKWQVRFEGDENRPVLESVSVSKEGL